MTNNKNALAAAGLATALLLLAACENMSGIRESSTEPPGSALEQPRLTRFSDIPIPAGARMNVTRSLILGPVDGWVGRLVFNTSTGSQTLFQFYTSEMQRFDWQEIARVRAQVSILTYTRGARTATVQISSTTLGGAAVSVTMAPSTKGKTPMVPSRAPMTSAPSSAPVTTAPIRSAPGQPAPR
jgi:hypothetical protein